MDSPMAKKSASAKRVKGGGPQDQAFDKLKNAKLGSRGDQVYGEASFQKGDGGIRGRKPTPDGVSVDRVNRTKTYWEDKRPSECEENSWRSPYKTDPIAKERTAATHDLKDGKITQAEAESRIVIAEHDDHYAKKGKRWNDPAGVPSQGYQDRLGVRLSDSPVNQDRIPALIKYLKDSGRNPQVQRENGIVSIMYDP
jgi:hypothetical protein